MKIINLMIVTFIVLLVAIGSVCAGTDDGLLSDGDDFGEDNEDDFELDDGDENDDSENSDGDLDDDPDDGNDLDDEEDDSDEDDSDEDDSDEDDSDEDDSDEEEEEFDGEFDGEFTALSAGLDLSSAKGMNGKMASNSNDDSQNSSDLSPKAGNPIGVLLLSLLFLIVIPLRNR